MQESELSASAEQLILVDKEDQVLGYLDKEACHNGKGVLHRAFSVFVFNSQGELLIQQRSREKRLWPGFWSNSCCSHPRRGEQSEEAALRRTREELGLTVELAFLYKFRYQARFAKAGSEHELCHVFIGKSDDPLEADAAEIAAWQWISPEELSSRMALKPGLYTPWFQLEWERLRAEHWMRITEL